ncbi:murein L,D-transpeptidase YafK [Xenorhabdus cabanillasii]|uniref:Murein L,D-transpeptidase YafK n=1 Tax=Xenorhabdus cabanillasii TaxID=351673 RepID=A0A3D9UKJ9_9GAMM|nr:murein L,D-transpeptidase family protein [Xenorhabdus cabanillasii]REF26524.1 murein L,D-transpeptidase YafK [Xenorhabdus cabanillasii]
MKEKFIYFSLILLLTNMPIFTLAKGALLRNNSLSEHSPLKQLGSEIFIQIFKEEKVLELYTKNSTGHYQLTRQYPVCNYSGGLGPKTLTGDFKSPEGFYHINLKQLKPDSSYYRAINLGFPNEFDKYRGYSGKNLMIHGECKSIGCYAMTNRYMDEIYRYVERALHHGQREIKINIYPFRMTPSNMRRHHNNANYPFWEQLQPAYEYFVKNGTPATVNVIRGQYIVSVAPPPVRQNQSEHAFTEVK